MKKGLTIGRYQPLHKGHFSVFKKMDEECDSIMIGVGSAQIEREKDNPLSGGERINMIKRVLKNRNIEPYEIFPVPDIECYPAWPYYVKNILPPFDYLYVHSRTVLRLFKGTKTKIRRVKEFNKSEWSATEVRRRIKNNEEWRHLVPKEVAEFLDEIDMKNRLKPTIEVKSETEKKVAHLLTKAEKTIATVESCTGGLIANRLTNVPGSSNYFIEGLVTYRTSTKTELLGIDEDEIEKHGVVSPETARKMAEKIRERADTDIGLSTTGLLGPGGNESEESIGTVYVGLSHPSGVEVEKFNFSGNRLEVKNQASEKSLAKIIKFLEK